MKYISPSNKGSASDGIVSRFLYLGEFFFGEPNCQIHTVLGSCIAITLWHPVLHVGCMCHFVLPGRRSVARSVHVSKELNGRYADEVMLMFEREAINRGTLMVEYQAKLFGGSNMLPGSSLQKDDLIGELNIVAALKHLSERDIPMMVSDVGATGPRRIVFDVASGDVWVKHDPLQTTALSKRGNQ